MINKMLLHVSVLATGVALLVGCQKNSELPATPMDGTGSSQPKVRLTLVPEWHGAPFALGTEYRDAAGHRLQVDRLKLYWGDIAFMGEDGPVPVKDVVLFDLKEPSTVELNVPAGTYHALHAGLGVPEAINLTDPLTRAREHPLSMAQGTYWSWASGYRFVTFEGRYDRGTGDSAPLDKMFVLHTGMDNCYTPFQLSASTPIVVQNDQVTEVVVRVAVDRFFHSGSGTLDLAVKDQLHGDDLALGTKLSDHVARSFSIN